MTRPQLGVTIPTIVLILAVVFVLGAAGVVYTQTIGKAQQNAEREVFKSSVAYTEQAASFLAKSYFLTSFLNSLSSLILYLLFNL